MIKKIRPSKRDYELIPTFTGYIEIWLFDEIPFNEIKKAATCKGVFMYREYIDMLNQAIIYREKLDERLKQQHRQPTRYELLKAFKDELPVIIHEKLKNKEDVETFTRLDQLISAHNNGKITDADVEHARHVPIVQVGESLNIEIDRSFKACCPFHNEKTPSFVFYRRTNTAHCFGCQKTVDSIALVMDYKCVNFIEAVLYLKSL